jgi:hypothetical protein
MMLSWFYGKNLGISPPNPQGGTHSKYSKINTPNFKILRKQFLLGGRGKYPIKKK